MKRFSPRLLESAALFSLLVLAAGAPSATAPTPEQKGFDIAARSDRSDRGFGDSEVALKMILKTRAGKTTQRDLKITTLEIPDENAGDKSLVSLIYMKF